MPSSSPSSAQAAREAVAERLREVRRDAGLTGGELADRCGWHKSKSSRIENARTPPSDADIRAWCRVCGAGEQIDDLIAASRIAESLYVEWKRKMRAGLRRHQESYIALYEHTRLLRAYSPDIVPGFLQTPNYAATLLSFSAESNEKDDDVEPAVAARMEHARVLYQGQHHFVVVLEEAVLQYRIGDAATMAGQLGHLLSVMSLPNVSLGVIPFSRPRPMWPIEPCFVFDDQVVQVELTTAELTIRAPTEVAQYVKTLARLQKMAVYGAQARALITSAIEALD